VATNNKISNIPMLRVTRQEVGVQAICRIQDRCATVEVANREAISNTFSSPRLSINQLNYFSPLQLQQLVIITFKLAVEVVE
jgi:hypothetical protein